MLADAALDTNVLVYAASTATEDKAKTERALRLIETVEFGLSAQSLAEFYNVTVRKRRMLDHHTALDWIEQMEELPVVPVDPSLVFQGAELSDRFGVSYWDGAILAAAVRLGVPTLYSEDLNHGQAYDGVTVINPFLD